MKHTATTIPSQLKKRNLICNESKNEDYLITRNGNKDYENCKYLGTMLDTKTDFKRRKALAISSMKAFDNIWENKHLPLRLKQRILNSCVTPVMLAGSELWILNESLKKQIDAFQRKLLRRMLNIKWPRKISNERLKQIVKYEEWSDTVKKSQIRWYGHALRLPEDAPCKIALKEYQRKTKRPRGGQKNTWIKQIHKELEKLNIDVTTVEELAKDRNEWRKLVGRCVQKAPNAEEPAK